MPLRAHRAERDQRTRRGAARAAGDALHRTRGDARRPGRSRPAAGAGGDRIRAGARRAGARAAGRDDAGYGDLHLEEDRGDGLVVRTVSVLDRGLVAPLTLRRGSRCTEVTYAIVQLPQDEALHAVALEFEARLIAALRRIDGESDVHLSGTALRDLASGVRRAPTSSLVAPASESVRADRA